jgi:methionyl-tRNA formyltransferase
VKTLLLTNENSALRIVKALADSTQIIIGLMSGKAGDEHPLQAQLEKSRIEYWIIDSLRDGELLAKMRGGDIDLLLTFRFPRIVPSDLIEIPRLGAFNLHTGPLPHYAGLNVPSWAIFNGETAHGVTLHRLAAGIDTGEIVMLERFPIEARETGITLTGKCVRIGSKLVSAFVRRLINGDTPAGEPQNLGLRKYFSKDIPGGGRIDWTWSAESIDRLIRASNFHPFASPWGVPLAQVNTIDFGILSAHVIDSDGSPPGCLLDATNDYFDIATSSGALRVREIAHGGVLGNIGDLNLRG